MTLLITSFIFGQLNRLFWPGLLISRVNLLDLIVLAFIIYFSVKGHRPALSRWLLAFLVLTLFSFWWGISILQLNGQPESFLFLLRLVLYVLWFGYSAIVLGKRSYQVVAYCGVGVAVFGLLQYFLFPSISVDLALSHGFDPHSGRLFSTFFDPNYTATILMMTSLVSLTLVLLQPKDKRNWWIGLTALQLFALLLTNSRSGLLALFVGLVIYLAAVNWRAMVLFGVVSFGIVLFVPAISHRLAGAVAIDTTAQSRFASWQTALTVIDQQPILGVGYNNYQVATTIVGRYSPRIGQIALAANASDSSLLTLWATTGLFATIAWLLFLLSEVKQTGYSLYQTATRRAVIAALLVNSLFINSLIWPFALFLLAIILVPLKIQE